MASAHHVVGWRACEGARLVGVADPDPDRAALRAGQAGAAAFPSLGAMLEACTLDAVDIVAPPSLHAPLVLEAARRGLPVLCQKPLAPTAAEARDLLDAMPADARLMVHENWRWRAPYRALRQGLADRGGGGPSSFALRVESSGLIERPDGHYPALERQPFLAGLRRFLVIEVLIHHLDTLEFLFGPLRIESAVLARRCAAVLGEDRADIRLTAGGVPGRLVGDFRTPGAPPLPRDRLTLSGAVPALVDGWTVTIGTEAPLAFDPDAAYAASYADTIAHFAACLEDGTAFETPGEAGARMLDHVERIYALAGRLDEADA